MYFNDSAYLTFSFIEQQIRYYLQITAVSSLSDMSSDQIKRSVLLNAKVQHR